MHIFIQVYKQILLVKIEVVELVMNYYLKEPIIQYEEVFITYKNNVLSACDAFYGSFVLHSLIVEV